MLILSSSWSMADNKKVCAELHKIALTDQQTPSGDFSATADHIAACHGMGHGPTTVINSYAAKPLAIS